jgi:glycerol-3-phosphate acyltransferase PlsY
VPDFFFGSFSYTWPLYAICAAAYGLGSIPFGLLLSKLANSTDPRTIGSGNIGATNILRTGNKGLATATLVLDIGKGSVATFIASLYGPDCAAAAALAVTLGHIFPLWLKFKGGKGVATAFGVIFVLSWPTGILSALTWLIIVRASGFSSLGAIVSLISMPFILAGLLALQRNEVLPIEFPGTAQNIETCSILALLITLRHFRNIQRLFSKTEPRISFSKQNALVNS